jgi:hypothetical protein
MGLDDSSTSSSTTVAASKQLQRRINGLGQRQWSVDAYVELLVHLYNVDSLLHLDILSDCIIRMAEHADKGRLPDTRKLFDYITASTGYNSLCRVARVALQQLAEGVQQYLQQGQLPAVLTERALDASYALWSMLTCISRWLVSANINPQESERSLQLWLCYDSGVKEGMCYNSKVKEGMCYVMLLVVILACCRH